MEGSSPTTHNTNTTSKNVHPLSYRNRGLGFDPVRRIWQGANCNGGCTSAESINVSIIYDDPSPPTSKNENHIWRRTPTAMTESTMESTAVPSFSGQDSDSSSQESATKLFPDCSLFKEENVSINIFSLIKTNDSSSSNNNIKKSNNKKLSSFSVSNRVETGRKGRYTYGVQNAASQQYCKGFPFAPQQELQRLRVSSPLASCNCSSPQQQAADAAHSGRRPNEELLVLSLCPPHDVELDAPGFANYMSFDLGFTILERNNHAYIMTVANCSPAMIAGVKPFYKIKFAFEQTLSSPFRASGDDDEVFTYGSVSFLSSSVPDIAVYHPSEHESKEAAEYALNCVRDGQETSFQKFVHMFPFDITKSCHSYKPAHFGNDKDPILYPVTIVFEKNTIDPKYLDEEPSENTSFSITDLPIFKLIFCLQNLHP